MDAQGGGPLRRGLDAGAHAGQRFRDPGHGAPGEGGIAPQFRIERLGGENPGQ